MTKKPFHITLFLTLLLSVAVNSLIAQKKGPALIDSILHQLPLKSEDSGKVNLLNRASFLLADYNTRQGIELGNQGLRLAEKLEWQTGIARCLNSIGTNHMQNNDLQKALEYYKKAYAINTEIQNKKQAAQNIGNISLIYQLLGNYPKALENLFIALKNFEEINDTTGVANQYGNIGNVYQEMGNPAKAIYYDSLALIKNKELNETDGVAMQLGNIGNALCDLGAYKKSEAYTMQSLQLFRELKQAEGITRNLNNLGVLYETQGRLAEALDYHFQSLHINQDIENKQGMMLSLGNIGEIYLKLVTQEPSLHHSELIPKSKQARLTLALRYLGEAVDIGNHLQELTNWSFYEGRYAEALEQKGDYKNALLHFKKYKELQDSVFNTDSKVKIENLTTEREVELKDKQIKIDQLAVEKKNERELFMLAGIILLLIIIFSVYRNFTKQKILNAELSIEKKKSDDLLLNILPAEVADELKSKGTSDAKHYDNVSVIFTDFINFSGISETMNAKELVSEIDYCFKAFDHIIERNGLEKIKTIGDAYLAVCGLPLEMPDHAERAVRAALEIRDFIAHNKSKFQIRIGIHSGPVVAGIVGVKKYAYDIWGDTVNTANRMETSAEEGKINISSPTYELVKDLFHCTHRGRISAKNKGDLDMYYVEG